MAMFSDYKGGGVKPVTGVVEAGANIGRMYQEGLTKLGEGIGKGISRYQETKKEDEMRTAEAEAEATKTKFLFDSIKNNPKLAPFAKSFEPHFANMGKFAEMDSKKKNAALLSLKAFNSNIAPALALYKEKGEIEDKSNLLTAQTNASSVGLRAIYDSISSNPELAPYAKKIQEHIVTLDKAKGMPESDKQNALLAAEAFHKTIPTTLPLFEKGLEIQTRREMDALKVDEKKFGKDPDVQNITLAIKNGWNPNISPSENVAQASAEVDKFLAANPDIQNTNKEAYMKAWLAHWRMKTSNATPDQMNPDTKARTLKQLDLLAQLPAQEMYSETDSGVEEAYLNAVTDTTTSAVQQKYDALRASQAKPSTTEGEKSVEQILAERVKTEKTPEFEQDLKLKTLGSQLVDETRVKLDKAITSGGAISVDAILSEINKQEKLRNPTANSFASGAIGMGGAGTGMGGGVSPTREVIVKKYSPAAEAIKKAATDAGINIKENLKTAESITKLRDALATVSKNIAGETVASAKQLQQVKTQPTAVEAIPEEPILEPSYDAQGRADTGMALGQRFQPVEITWQEKKSEMKDWFIKTKGQVPMSFDKIFEDRYPESKLKVVKTAIGDMWSDGEKWHLAPAREVKQMSEKEKSEFTLYNYGTVNQQTGKVEYEERIPNSGILTLGSIKGGEKKAEAFDNLASDVDKIRTYVPKLIAMFGKVGHSIPKGEHGAAEIMMTELKAAIRVKTVGTGPVALPEHAMIAKQIGDPTAFFAWDAISLQKLQTLLSTAESSLVKNSAGIKVQLRPAGQQVEQQSEQAKLDIKLANRNKRTN